MDPETHKFLNKNNIKEVEDDLCKIYPCIGNQPDKFYSQNNLNNNRIPTKTTVLENFAYELGRIN